MQWRRMLAALLGVVALGAMAGCGSSKSGGSDTASSTNGGSTGNAHKPYRIAFISALKGVDFTTSQDCGAQAEAAKLGVQLDVKDPTQYDPAVQTQIVEAVTATKPDAIVTFPVDSQAMIAPLKAAKQAGIKIVLVDNPLNDPSISLSDVLGDNFGGGKLAGEAMARMLGGHGTVLIVGQNPGDPVNGARDRGFIAGAKAGGLTVLPVQYAGKAGPTKATSIVEGTLAQHRDLAGIFGENLAAYQGVPLALEQAGKTGKVKFIMYDAFSSQVQQLRAGKAQGLVAQQPYQEGVLGIQRAVDALDGKSVPRHTTLSNVLVTQQNVDRPDVAKVLYKTHC